MNEAPGPLPSPPNLAQPEKRREILFSFWQWFGHLWHLERLVLHSGGSVAFEKTSPIVLKPSKPCWTWLVISQLYSIPEEHNTVKVAICLQVKKAGPRIRDRSLILTSSFTSLLTYLNIDFASSQEDYKLCQSKSGFNSGFTAYLVSPCPGFFIYRWAPRQFPSLQCW